MALTVNIRVGRLRLGILLAFGLLLIVPSVAAAAPAAAKPCSAYPTPGSLAPSGTKVPPGLAAEYAVLERPQRKVDKLRPSQLGDSLSASGVVMSGIRLLGTAPLGGRVYLLPAQHLLAFKLAPARCLPPAQRSLEQILHPSLVKEYAHRALCLIIVYGKRGTPTCSAAPGMVDPLLFAAGAPGFGLTPNGVNSVEVLYSGDPAIRVKVKRNFWLVNAPNHEVPCGLSWYTDGIVVREVKSCLNYNELETSALSAYRSYVAGKLSALRSQVSALAAAIGSGNLSQAEAAWLTAHLTWLDIGQDDGAYGCFGDLGGEIDGLAAGHPQGTADPGFTGFHKIEFDLWTNHDLTAAANDTNTLQNLLSQLMAVPLSAYLPANNAGISNWVLRPHEVLEDALRDSLTANDDYGSGTGLASLTADASAIQVMLGELETPLNSLDPGLVTRASGELDALDSAIAATKVNGSWVSVEDLPTRQRQQVDAAAGAAAETLASVPDLLTNTGGNGPTD